MGRQPCDGCGRKVRIGGGISDFWTMKPTPTDGMTLEFEDDTEHFLCNDCIDELPDYPEASDVEALESRDGE